MFKESIIVALVVAERPLGDRVDKELNNWGKMGTGDFFFFFLKAGKFQPRQRIFHLYVLASNYKELQVKI